MNRKSKLRITLVIMVSLFLVFTIGNFIAMQYSRKKILGEAEMIAMGEVDNMLLKIDVLQAECEVSGNNLKELIESWEMSADSDYAVLDTFFLVNSHLYGITLGFEPDFIEANHMQIPSMFVYRDEEGNHVHAMLDSIYDPTLSDPYAHTKKDWYAHTKACMEPNWGKPLVSVAGTLEAPYCLPVRDANLYTHSASPTTALSNPATKPTAAAFGRHKNCAMAWGTTSSRPTSKANTSDFSLTRVRRKQRGHASML